MLPTGCCGPKGRPLRMPNESELEEMADAKALEAVLARLLVFGGYSGDDVDGVAGFGGRVGGRERGADRGGMSSR